MANPDPVPYSYDRLDQFLELHGEKLPMYKPRPPGESHASYVRKHDGQRKLLLSEIEFLTLAMRTFGKEMDYAVVYAGSAPGTHLKLLIWLFPQVRRWVFIDPNHPYGQFDVEHGQSREHSQVLLDLLDGHRTAEQIMTIHTTICSRVEVVRAYASTYMIQKIFQDLRQKHKCVPLLISDIRTSYKLTEDEEVINAKVRADMALQQEWHKHAVPWGTMVKFRLDYVPKVEDAEPIYFPYMGGTRGDRRTGELYLQAWARPNSSETRLIVFDGRQSPDEPLAVRRYNVQRYRDVMYYFNRQVRELQHNAYEAEREMSILGAFEETIVAGDEIFTLLQQKGFTGERGLSKLFTIVLKDGEKTRKQFEQTNEQRPEGLEPTKYETLSTYKPAKHESDAMSVATSTDNSNHLADVRFFNEVMVQRFFNSDTDDAAEFTAALLEHTGPGRKWKTGAAIGEWPVNRPPQWCAAQTGKLNILKALARDFHCALDSVGPVNASSLLHDAAFYCQTEVVRWLFEDDSVRRHITTRNRPTGSTEEQETPLEAAKAGQKYYRPKQPRPEQLDQFRVWRNAKTTPNWDPVIKMLEDAAAAPPSLTYQLRLRF